MTGAEIIGSLIDVGQGIVIVSGAAAVVAAFFVVRVTQHRAVEWKDLALARSEVVDTLRQELADLRQEVGKLQGAITALESVKAQEIAERVIDLMGQSAFVWDNPHGTHPEDGV